MVPPIRLWDQGVPNQAALRIMTRNSRMPDSLAADLDAECSACLMGARRLGELFDRYGRERRRGVLRRDPRRRPRGPTSGRSSRRSRTASYVWEDYAEHDGVDEPRLHTQRITLTKTSTGGPDPCRRAAARSSSSTSPAPAPQAKGPINHCGDYADGNFLIKWLAPILRNLADTPERMAELDVNEGVVPLVEMRFPPKGTLLTPVFPAPTNARTFVILRLLGVLAGVLAKATGGRMPADQETIRYTGVHGHDADGRPLPDARGARRRLGRALLRRRRGHHPRRPGLPEHPHRVQRVAASRCGSSGSGSPSTPAAPAGTAAASGTRSTSGCCATRRSCRSPTARSCRAGASTGGRAGRPFQVTDRPGRPERARGRRPHRRRAGRAPAR